MLSDHTMLAIASEVSRWFELAGIAVIVLGGIVLIRTFLSISLEVEIEGKWPWRRTADDRSSR